MSFLDRTGNIPKFGGNIWYVSNDNGVDTNNGETPQTAYKTIGKAITVLTEGDAITIMAGTYAENALDLDVNNCELWFEIGAILAPTAGTGITISGNNCLTKGLHRINAVAGEVGKLVTGNFCHITDGRIIGGAEGLKIEGTGAVVNNYACGSQTTMAYDLKGDALRMYRCSTVGIGSSRGYFINNNSNTGVLENCTSVGHELNGYYISSGSTNWTIINCSTGGADGNWRDIDDTNVFSNFMYPETKYKEITLDNSHEYSLFKVTGTIEIQEIFGHVTTVLAGANTDVYWNLESATSSASMTKTTGANMGAAVVGSVIIKTEDPGKSATFLDGAGASVDNGIEADKEALIINANKEEDTYIKWVCGGDNDTSGVLHFHVVWRPLTNDGFLEVV